MNEHIDNHSKNSPNLKQLSEISSTVLSKIALIATDMDGTVTHQGKYTAKLLQALEELASAKVGVLIVTGRSAGWVNGISSLMPIVGAIAENGGVFYPEGNFAPIALTPISNLLQHRQNLASAFTILQTQYPQIRESTDNRFRITDWTFDVVNLQPDQLENISKICQDLGWGFTYSNVQCHIKPQEQDKAVGLLQVLNQFFPDYSPAQIVTVGDSPNDESLFNQRYFPVSVGVANIREYTNRLQHKPAYITQAAEGEGFCELSRYILQSLPKNQD